jgi:ABC-type Na+ efflux pump permease subunit
MLNRNPIFWLASRSGWPTVQIWSWLGFSTLFWGWLLWLTWVKRTLNVAIVFVVGLGASWLVSFLVMVPAEASRRLVEDRMVGALELLLCTPLREQDIIQGQWLALRRRYLVPLILAMLLSAGLMVSGYVTFGFGGMLDPEDRGLWLGIWLGTLGLLPGSLAAICWLAMRRSLFARNAGEASSIALMQMVGVPGVVLACAPMLWHSLLGWNPEGWTKTAVLLSAYTAWLLAFSWLARRRLFLGLRQAAAPHGSAPATPIPRGQLNSPDRVPARV